MMDSRKSPQEILKQYPADPRYTLEILHGFQNTYGYVSADHMKQIAEHLQISLANVFSEVSFYDAFTTEKQGAIVIQVCDGTVCHSQGSGRLLAEFEALLGIKAGETTADGAFSLRVVRCMGACGHAPAAACGETVYGELEAADAKQLTADPDAFAALKQAEEIRLLDSKYERVLLKEGETFEAYERQGGFQGLKKALGFERRKQILDEVNKSGLRGRSGSGFPVGSKWKSAYDAQGRSSNLVDKYIIANGDEGDPGAFMDKWLMEKTPYAILEGMVIAGRCIGANRGFIYIRDEYPRAIAQMETAIAEMERRGLLGRRILGSDYSLSLEVVQAARSYVCGEESALMESIEGKPGVPRLKPPFPTFRGILEQPTLINNVETFANIPLILREGGEAFARRGAVGCSGTKLLSLTGSVKNKGLVEIPLGTVTLRELIYEIGGGIEGGRRLKCVQTGGPSGCFISAEDLDMTLDFDAFSQKGFLLGSGGVIVIDDSVGAVELAKHTLEFLADESCGTCTPCREGLRVMLEIFERLTAGRGEEADLKTIEKLAFAAKTASRCALGKTIGNPVLSTLRAFREEYGEHISSKEGVTI